MNIGATIKLIRKERKIRQGKLASLCEMSQNTLSHIESSKRIAREKNLENICKHLNVTIGGLYIMSITEQDVPEQKREAFNLIKPIFKNIFLDK